MRCVACKQPITAKNAGPVTRMRRDAERAERAYCSPCWLECAADPEPESIIDLLRALGLHPGIALGGF